MSEQEINQRRNWKAITLPYDEFFPDESEECNYCLTYKQAELLRGIIEPMAWDTRWWSNTQEIDKQALTDYRDDIIRRLIMSCCGGEFEIIFQWTEDGVLQSSNDDGETWVDSPQDDPRNSSPVYPPVPGEPTPDKKCIAAIGMQTLIKEQVGQQITDDMTRFTLGELIQTWIDSILQTSNPFQALINIAVNQIFALVLALLVPALTDSVYLKLRCAFYDHMQDDLSFTEADWVAVRNQILATISGIAGVFLEHLVFLLGKVGLTNLARSQAASTGTADDCDCAEYIRVYVSPGGGTEVSWDGVWLTANPVVDGDHYTLFIQTTPDTESLDVNNCGIYQVQLLSGSISIIDSAYRPCGGGALVPIGLTPLDTICTCQLAIRNLEPATFQVRVRAVDCS